MSRRIPCFWTCFSPLAWVQAPLTPSSDIPTKASAFTPMISAETCPAQPHLVWASLGERPGGCRRGRVLWFLCPCPCRCPGPYASVCVWVCSPATRSTRSLTQQRCQLFPLNTTSPLLHCPPLPTPGEIVPPLMRSHILMSSDVSGIPSFPPPLPSLCVASLREHTHTLRSLVKT